MGGEILAVTGSQSPALLSSARRSVLDRATAPQSSALRNPDTRWGSHGDLRPLMGAEVVTPEEPHPNHSDDIKTGCEHERGRRVGWVPDPASAVLYERWRLVGPPEPQTSSSRRKISVETHAAVTW